jgi:hypothetical protein
MFYRLIDMILHLVLVTKVLERTPPSTSIEFYPKQSIAFN